MGVSPEAAYEGRGIGTILRTGLHDERLVDSRPHTVGPLPTMIPFSCGEFSRTIRAQERVVARIFAPNLQQRASLLMGAWGCGLKTRGYVYRVSGSVSMSRSRTGRGGKSVVGSRWLVAG